MKNVKGRGPRIGHSKRGQQDLKVGLTKDVELDTSLGLTGVLHQVSHVIWKFSNNTKSRDICLSYINSAVKYLNKVSPNAESKFFNTSIKIAEKPHWETTDSSVIENWKECQIKEKYFCLLRCALLHKRKEVRVAVLRLLRYLVTTEDDVLCLKRSNLVSLIVRCIDISLDNHNERVQGVRLTRRLMQVSPLQFPASLARCLIAVARDGARDRDKLLRTAQAIVNEMAILNPQVFVDCGGVSCTLYNILDCPLTRINEALMSSLLFLLNDPRWRSACSEFHMIMAPFSDIHYRHLAYDPEYSKAEEREVRVQSSCCAALSSFRSWPGLITLYQPRDNTIQTLIDLLRFPNESTRETILDFLYDLLRIQPVESSSSFDEALQERAFLKPADPDMWRLHEGFIVAEAKVMLSHIAKFRPNLIQNYFSLVLYTLVKKGLLSALCHVIVTASNALSVKATVLLGETLHMVDQNLPDCGMQSHALPILSEKAAGTDAEQRLKASQAITALLQLSRIRLAPSEGKGLSLYLRHIVNMNKEEKTPGPALSAVSDPTKLSKWLGKDHDDLVQQTLKDSGIFSEPYTNWKWNLLIHVLRWPSSAFLAMEESSYRMCIEILLHHFKPSSKEFSRVEVSHSAALVQAEALVVFVQFLLRVSVEDQREFLVALLEDINGALKIIEHERLFHDSYLSPSQLVITVSQYYFLAIGSLTKHERGYELVLNSGIYDQMLSVVGQSLSDIYAKLFVSTLDYSINGMNRTILNKVLTSTKDGIKMYATQMMRVLVRAHAKGFTKWGVELLVGQLYDKSKRVALVALEVLDEALDNEEYLEAVLENRPSVQHLGDYGQVLLAKLVSSPRGFRTYHDCNFISSLLDKWVNTFNLKYVKLMQTALAESLTQLQRGEDGLYGRRTGSKHVVHDVYVLPHLYGSLAVHEEGFSLLIQHHSLASLMQIVREGKTSTIQEIIRLESAIWALGHFGRSSNGVDFLNSENMILCLVDLAASCPVYSVRGVVFHAICLIATTWDGANILQKYGWESVRRHHQEQRQTIQDSFWVEDESGFPKRTPTQHYESDTDDPEAVRAKFDIMDESEDETESLSFPIEDLDVDAAANRKSQTLPHDSKPSSHVSHQRSFSDCAPVMEELVGGSQHQSTHESSFTKRSSQLKNKILSSFRRKSSKRRDSVGSRTSNSSSASEKVLSFLHPSRRRKRGSSSFGSTGKEDDVDSSQSHSCTDDELILDEINSSFETPRLTKLTPIASGASLSGIDPANQPTDNGTLSSPRDSAPVGENVVHLSPTHHFSGTSSGLRKIRALAMHRRNVYKSLALSSTHRRGVSESSHEEMPLKNSLRDFLSSSYEQSSHAYPRGMARSPSGCSELSSVRSYGTLGPRGGSSNWLLGRGREETYALHLDDDPGLCPSGQCYLGLALHLNIDKLLLDTSCTRDYKESDVFAVEWTEAEMKPGRKKSVSQKKIPALLDEKEAFEFHKSQSCLGCYSFASTLGLKDAVRNASDDVEVKRDSPSLRKTVAEDVSDKRCETPKSSDTKEKENGCESSKSEKGPLKNRYLFRKEILRHVSNLLTPFITKSSEAGLLALKSRLSWAFQDACLYEEVCLLLSSYSFRLNARRFIQELFLDLAFTEVFEDAHLILASAGDAYKNLEKKIDSVEDDASRGGPNTSIHHDIPEYNINDFEGFDMEEV